MIKYAKIIDEEIGSVSVALGEDIEYYIKNGFTELDVDQSEKDNMWYLIDKCPHYTPKEKEDIEKEKISHLQCTKRVLALMLQQLGISYSQLKALIATNEQAQLEWDLCVELERCNPLLDIMGEQLGLSHEQIDQMFKYANGWVDTLEVE